MRIIRVDLNTFFVFVTALLIVITFIPISSIITTSAIRVIIILSGIITYSRIKNNIAFLELFIFTIVMVIYFFVGKGLSFNAFGLINWMLCFFSAGVISLAVNYLEYKHINFLICLLIVLMIYSNISTIIISVANPMAVRMFGYGGMQELYSSIGKSVGPIHMYSYGVGEAMAIISPILLAYSLGTKNKLIKVSGIVAVCLSIVSQAMAALTTSLFLTLFFCAMVLFSFLNTSRLTKRFKIILFLAGVILILSPFYLRIIGNNSVLMDKIGDIAAFFSTGSSTGDVSVRRTLILRSIRVWLHNPLFGWAEVGGVNIENGVSMHSALFDYLGLYGIFTVFLFLSWKNTIMYQFRSLTSKEKRYYKWGIVSLIFLLIIKGPVTIATNYFFSAVLCGLLIKSESHRIKMQESLNG